jgi:hypothetical protein
MEEKDILNLWNLQEAQLQQSLAVNNLLIQELQTQKVRSVLRGLTIKKAAGILSFLIWLMILGSVIFIAIRHYEPSAIYFIISMAGIMAVNIKGLSDHIRHIAMINSINYDAPVTDMQQRLSLLQASFVKNVRIMFLQFPFWSTWHLHVTLFGTAGWWGWLLQFVLTGSFVYISYWVYKNLSMENRNKKWFRSLVEGSGAQSVAKAMAFYEEVEAFKGLKG